MENKQSSDAPPNISVIIVNYNSGDRLARCLEALRAQTYNSFEAIVIDNASADASIAKAKATQIAVRFIDAGGNLGFAAANNRAVLAARGDFIAFLNPDAYAAPNWLERLVAASERYPWADAFGSTQLDAENPQRIDGAGDVFQVFGIPYRGHHGWPAEQLPGDGECFAPCAAAALYRRNTFLSLGGFDERFFCYGEDVDLGFRLRLRGGRAIQIADAVVYHEGSGITGRHSDFTIFHGHRNRIWTAYKNMPGALYWPLIPFQLAANFYLLFRSIGIGIGKPYWRALIAGYAGLPRLAASRRAIQKSRRVALAEISKAMTWSPLKVSRREADLKPIARPESASPADATSARK